MFATRLIRRGIRLKGRVVGHVHKPSVDQEIQYAPIVAFIDQDGAARSVTSDRYRLEKLVINSPIDVYYDENNPDDILIDNGIVLISRLIALLVLVVCWVIMNVIAVNRILG
ncbi:DUF3592 domain-containing protein [Chitinophaga sp. CF418]|uniref:DUF3592 domain-containing protein n=1 Tax=Chitinophaga sp. CF418 TaxID=1855287 RepID=UPI000922EA07|nr:DUF3592 domain-containing protein [Chitinophaga sp. CF418]SHN40393.1 hypothetical protein SAMN05216311_1123 [Chitinophaga sp. CF418]